MSTSSPPEDLKTLLHAQGVKAMRLAEYLGVPRSSISRWQSGRVGAINSNTALRIAEYLHTDASRVLRAFQVSRRNYLMAHPEKATRRLAERPQRSVANS